MGKAVEKKDGAKSLKVTARKLRLFNVLPALGEEHRKSLLLCLCFHFFQVAVTSQLNVVVLC